MWRTRSSLWKKQGTKEQKQDPVADPEINDHLEKNCRKGCLNTIEEINVTERKRKRDRKDEDLDESMKDILQVGIQVTEYFKKREYFKNTKLTNEPNLMKKKETNDKEDNVLWKNSKEVHNICQLTDSLIKKHSSLKRSKSRVND